MTTLNFFASCAKYLEGMLEDEIRHLGATDCKQTVGGVHFSGSLEFAYRVCLWSRLANHVLLVLVSFPADSANELYAAIQTISWAEHLAPQGTFYIDVTGQHDNMNNTLFIAQRTKDAIVDQLRTESGERPSIDPDRPDILIHLHCRGNQLELSLDLSGGSLHRRGYRLDGGRAPLKETLAAALLIRAGWPQALTQSSATLLDPMCGTGTILVEAALMAYDIAPGLAREHFGFLQWRQHQPDSWRALVDEAQTRKAKGLEREGVFIFGRDNHPQAIDKSEANIARASLSHRIDLQQQDCTRVTVPAEHTTGLIVCNPPYGERLNTDEFAELERLFQRFGERLQTAYLGWKLALISGAPVEVIKSIGLRSHKQYSLMNGAIPCKVYCFDLVNEKVMLYETPEEKQQRIVSGVIERGLSESAKMFENRLTKNIKHLKKWRQREGVECYRVYDADIPEYAAAIDLYTTYHDSVSQGWFAHVQEYEPGKLVDPAKAKQRCQEMVAIVHQVLQIPTDRIVLKVRKRQRGESQYQRFAEQETFYMIQEGPARFLVNFTDYLDPGVFIDHRLVRKKLAELSEGRTMLNLFAYTCTASVQAALAGARCVTSVDLSKTYLDWGQRNFLLNRLRLGQHEFLHADCLTWLKDETIKYDVIFLNPPTFSNSKRMENTLDITRDQVDLIRLTMKRVAKGGCLIFSCNQRNFKLEPTILEEFQCVDISKQTLSEDFAGEANRHHVWEIKAF